MQYFKWLLALICISPLFLFANESDVFASESVLLRTHKAIDQGLAFLVKHQDKKGAFVKAESGYEEFSRYRIAITSFACLALMANGNLPRRGKYGESVQKGLDYILSCVGPSGYITDKDEESRMHGHCYATLFLAQAYGMTANEKIKKKLNLAIKCIIRAQVQKPGKEGWGYLPDSDFHEGSITVCALQAMRAARNVGVKVPKRSIDLAIRYLRNSANPDGSFKYRLGMDSSRRSFPLTAAGVSSLNATGEYQSKEIARGLKFMMLYIPPHGKKDQYYTNFYYYGHFYAAQAMYQAPPEFWRQWFPAIRDELLESQNIKTGAWGEKGNRKGMSRFGDIYATAIATLVLQIPYSYLPIFQK